MRRPAKGECERRPTAGTAPRFRFVDANGVEVIGAVQGSGGIISSLARLQTAQRQATRGRATGLYEPERGCVAVHPDYNVWSNGPERVVSLVGVRIEVA